MEEKKEKEMKYEEELIGKGSLLHERFKKKHLFIKNFIEIITNFETGCQAFIKSMTLISNKNYQLLEDKDTSVYSAIQNLINLINVQIKEYSDLYNNIKINILEQTEKLLEELNHNEKELFTAYAKSLNQYNNAMTTLDKSNKEYDLGLKSCERDISRILKLNENPALSNAEKEKNNIKLKNIINNSRFLENKYVFSIDEANKKRINRINSEKKLLEYYHNVDKNHYNKIKEMLQSFLGYIFKVHKTIISSLDNLNKYYNQIDIEKDINNYIIKNKGEKYLEEPIQFIPYKPQASLETTSITGDQNEIDN